MIKALRPRSRGYGKWEAVNRAPIRKQCGETMGTYPPTPPEPSIGFREVCVMPSGNVIVAGGRVVARMHRLTSMRSSTKINGNATVSVR
jgi:hypothetical protein